MKILLISPRQTLAERTPSALQIPQIALQLLAGLTDAKHEVRIVEEEFVDVDMSLSPDLVGLSLMTANAPRGYALADHFRARGAKLVLGGIHPSVLPEEALEHADSVVVGEAEELWPQVVADVEAGRPKPIYKADRPADLTKVPFPRRDIGRVKRWLNVLPVMTTRGCPYSCEFCSVSAVYGRKIRNFPVDWVVHDIKRAGGKVHLILDDNIIARPAYAEELFKALKPLKIYWVGQASMSFALREDLMRLAYESGCRGLFFGMETVSEESMRRMKKSFRDLNDVADGIRLIQAAGIRFHASVVFGFDTDDATIFQRTVDFLMTCRVHSVSFNILTPYPGTRVYAALEEDGRLFTRDWRYYNHMTVVFRPARMTALELAEGHLRARRNFYRGASILQRAATHWRHPVFYGGMNLAYRRSAKRARLPIAPGWESSVPGWNNGETHCPPAADHTGIRRPEAEPSSRQRWPVMEHQL